ncbi:hypothetical protein PCANC_15793 [Puccinia coronata f. sp. avenae]|uniref:Uncharacterized protein n=2 Tax=Puccinia coronata f. sp. avenae TaxID=200324 RepID=A0A2N5SZ00_9BASI|nr:hypothetical protein PCANC_15793 [Puccinia coronata f. sp. avenae]
MPRPVILAGLLPFLMSCGAEPAPVNDKWPLTSSSCMTTDAPSLRDVLWPVQASNPVQTSHSSLPVDKVPPTAVASITSSPRFTTPSSSCNPTYFPATLNSDTHIPHHSFPPNDQSEFWFDDEFHPHTIDQLLAEYRRTLEGDTSDEPPASHQNNPTPTTTTSLNLQSASRDTQTAQKNQHFTHILNPSTISELPQSKLQIVNRPSISGSPSNHQEEPQLVSSNPS